MWRELWIAGFCADAEISIARGEELLNFVRTVSGLEGKIYASCSCICVLACLESFMRLA